MGITESPGCDYYVRYTISQGTSVKAIDTANGNKLIGVRGHRIVNRGDECDYDPPADEPFDKVVDLVDHCWNKVDPWKRFDVDKFLECKFLTVDRNYRGQNIGVKMMNFTVDFMRANDVPLIYIFGSSYYTAEIMKKMDFEVLEVANYADYKENGKAVFKPAHPHTFYIVGVKWIIK